MFQVPSTIESVSTRADNSIKIVLGTQELPPDQAAELFRMKGQVGWFLFKDSEIIKSDIPDEPVAEFKGDKTPSQRLRAALYVYWEKCTSKNPDFNTFYQAWIERKINEIKEQLPPQTEGEW